MYYHTGNHNQSYFNTDIQHASILQSFDPLLVHDDHLMPFLLSGRTDSKSNLQKKAEASVATGAAADSFILAGRHAYLNNFGGFPEPHLKASFKLHAPELLLVPRSPAPERGLGAEVVVIVTVVGKQVAAEVECPT